MAADIEASAVPWKWIAVASLVVATVSLIALVAVVAYLLLTTPKTDPRLIGTWQSDADRTIAGIRERKPVDDKQEAALRNLFGKLRVTYAPTTITTDLDGKVETSRYQVLGSDQYSVAIREVERKPSPIDGLFERSEFTVIQFDGPDSYWLYTSIGGVKEYFKRVR